MRMKNKELFDLKLALDEIVKANYKASVEFSFAIIKNKKVIEARVEDIQAAIKPSEDYLTYDKERVELLKECSTTEDGEIKTKDLGNGNIEYLIRESKMDEFKKGLDILKDKYEDVLKEQDGKQSEIESFLEEEVEDFEAIKLIQMSKVPEDFKTVHLEKIFSLLED